MDPNISIGERLRRLRALRGGLTQEQLAEKAGVSVTCVRKLEQGGTGRMETYHALARALGVRTVWFMTPETPDPASSPMRDTVLADIRSAVNPPMGPGGRIYAEDDVPPDLDALAGAVAAVAEAYQSDAYDTLARAVPAVVRSAHAHVRELDGRDRERARYLRADALQLAGSYLLQIREHDLALIALRDALTDAVEVGARNLIAAAISRQGWALLRQARFDEAEALCVAAADAFEPRMSTATPDELVSWGLLLVRASGAAARNNRAAEARELQATAAAAAARLGREYVHTHSSAGHLALGPISAAMNGMQNELVAGRPGRALKLSAALRASPGGVPHTLNAFTRFRLDEAKALADTGKTDQATEVLTSLRAAVPSWFRQQQAARDLAGDILLAAKRKPSEGARANADFLGVVV